jgi:hypothetical protein
MRRIVRGMDVSVAWQTIRKAMVDWPGFISQKQLVKFFRTGYLATDINSCPGGFALFMFRPTDHPVARSAKEGQNLLRSMFGEAKLHDKTIKCFSESEFFIALNPAELEDQIAMGIKTMDLFTRPKSIRSDGLRYRLKLLQLNRPMFGCFFREDPLFGARLPEDPTQIWPLQPPHPCGAASSQPFCRGQDRRLHESIQDGSHTQHGTPTRAYHGTQGEPDRSFG